MTLGSVLPGERFRMHTVARPPAATFVQDVRDGLLAQRKQIPAKYFYDEVGSALFDAITLLPEYYLTRAETAILREYGWEMVRALGNPIGFFELGSGSALKTRILIEEALRVQRTLQYAAVDIAEDALLASARALTSTYSALTVDAYLADYTQALPQVQRDPERRTLALFMGSNLGNYEPDDARALVAAIARTLAPRDGLLVGLDRKKDAAVLERAYDDASGVTAAFNYNLLARMNRELGATFDRADFIHRAVYDEAAGAVRSYLEAVRPVRVRIAALDRSVTFALGERVHTESSYKFSRDDVEGLAEAAGLELRRLWTDADDRFYVALLVKDARDAQGGP